MKLPITINLNVDILVSESVDAEEFYKSILDWFEAETERLKMASGVDRWPRGTISGASGLGAEKLVENALMLKAIS